TKVTTAISQMLSPPLQMQIDKRILTPKVKRKRCLCVTKESPSALELIHRKTKGKEEGVI
ncbi:hypothetical protein H0H93_005016, partial [Arthromyces matolae]